MYSYTVLLFRPYYFPFTRRADLVTEDAIIIQGGATCPLVVIKRLSLQTQFISRFIIAGISSFLIFPNNLTYVITTFGAVLVVSNCKTEPLKYSNRVSVRARAEY